MKILLIIISFVLPAAGYKKNNEKPQAPPTPSRTYITNVDLTTTQQTIRGFGGATVFRPDLADSNINNLFDKANDGQSGLVAALNWNGLAKRFVFNVNEEIASVSFEPHTTSDTKKITTESAVNITGTSFTYNNLPSLIITTFVSG